MNPKISIIIPTLNEEKIIEKTIQNLRNLKDISYEIIISDGKSTDKTIEIAKKYADKVVVYDGKTRQTIGMGRNLGAQQATGDFLVFLDSDLYIPNINQFFNKTIENFKKDKKLVALTVCLKVFPEVATLSDKVIFKIVNYIFFFFNNVFHTGGASGEFQMIRADIFNKLGGYNETLAAAEDNELFVRLAKVGRTHIEMSLFILHTSRRAHKIGWPKLLSSWLRNHFSMVMYKKSWNQVWEEVR